MRYIIHVTRGRTPAEADELIVSYPAETKRTGKMIGPFPEAKATGRFIRSRLYIQGRTRSRATGKMLPSNHPNFQVENTAAAVKGFVRVMREAEQMQLDDIDEQIDNLRARRTALLKSAWAKGHAVQVGELRAQADERARPKAEAS